MTLCLHAGAETIDYAGLRGLDTPVATRSHVPLPHFKLVDLVAHSLAYHGHEVYEQAFGMTPDGAKFFAVLKLRSPHTGYTDMVALRNSHDKSLPVGIGFGSSVFCCDNLAFTADHVIRTKHTANLKMRLPGLVGQLIEPIADQREHQAKQLAHYRDTDLTEAQVDHAIMQMYREGVVSVTQIAHVWQEWEEPSFEELRERHNAWRLFNAVTFKLTGKVMENPSATTALHRIIDGTVH